MRLAFINKVNKEIRRI